MRLLWLLVVLLPSMSFADSCYRWRAPTSFNSQTYTGARAWFNNPLGAAQEIAAWCTANAGTSGYCNVTCSGGNYSNFQGRVTAGTFPTYTAVVDMTCPSNGATTDRSGTLVSEVRGSCPSCPAAGTERLMSFGNATSTKRCVENCLYNTPPASLSVTATGATNQLSIGYSTGEACGQSTASGGSTTYDPADNTNECQTTGGGDVVCGQKYNGKNCGTFNGDRVCVESVQPGSCVSYQSGGVACVSSSSGGTATPPDNGDGSTPAEPDMQVTHNNTTVNYYSSTTVNNSAGTVTTGAPRQQDPTGTVGGDSETPSGGGGGDGEGDGDGEGGACEGDDCDVPDLGEVDTFGELTSAFMSAAEDAPLMAALAGVGTSIPAGSCPTYELSILGETYTLDLMCSEWDDFAGVLSTIMLCGWGLLAMRVLFSA